MFSQGLSLDQAPPVSVPFRFFLSAPLFGVLLGSLFFFFPFSEISNQYSSVAIGAIHFFTLGMLSMIIFGAMQQMMPVLAGATIKKSNLFAWIVHSCLVLGTLGLSFSFILGIKMLLHLGVLLLTISFLTFFLVSIRLLFKVEFLTSTVKAMRLFSLAGFITAILGIYLAIAHMSSDIGIHHYSIVNLHILFGLFGFATLLIMGVSFQIIPMFYVSPDLPKIMQDKAPLLIFILLFVSGIFLIFDINFFVLKVIFVAILSTFAFYALKSLNNRRRPVFDVTLWYWKLSLLMLIVSMVLWLINPFESNFLLAITFLLGFLYSLLQGMVYKIIPFLAWFHLSSKGYFQLPTIREFIEEKNIKYQFYFHCFSLLFFVLSIFINSSILIAAFLFICSNILFFINCLVGIKKYAKIAKTDPMDMSAFK